MGELNEGREGAGDSQFTYGVVRRVESLKMKNIGAPVFCQYGLVPA